jgi:acyl carrier protein
MHYEGIKLKWRREIWMSTVPDVKKIILRVANIMIDVLKLEDVAPETFDPEIDLINEVGIDSMDLATVALVLRDEYAIRIDEDDYPKLTNIRLISEYIHNKLKYRS